MAATIRLLDPSTGVIVKTYTVTEPASGTGIYHDGSFFWVTDSTSIYQYFIDDTDTMRMVNTWSLTAIIPNSTAIHSVCGDGLNLYVGWEGSIEV